MRVIVNGETREAAAATLAGLLAELAFEGAWLSTAVNGDFVPAGERKLCMLRDGDRVEVLSPMQGG